VCLCLNATGSLTTAVVCQFDGKALHILGDCVSEQPAAIAVEEIIRDTVLAFSRKLSLFAPRSHFQRYDAVGLVAAARRCQQDLRAGGDIDAGRAELRRLLQQQTRGEPTVRVSTSAHSTLNALAGGYAHPINRQGMVAEEPADGVYRLLMESVESFMATAQVVGEAQPENWAIDQRSGRPYKTISPGAANAVRNQPRKDRWWEDVDPPGPQSIFPRDHPHHPLNRQR
jgi:hypothetical protein